MYSRAFTPSDSALVTELHDKYFGHQFECPNFEEGYLNAFVICNNQQRPLIVGGVRAIAETIIVTDKSPEVSRFQLWRALAEALRISQYTCLRCGIDTLHAFVKDDKYAKHLMKQGFNSRSKALSLKVF